MAEAAAAAAAAAFAKRRRYRTASRRGRSSYAFREGRIILLACSPPRAPIVSLRAVRKKRVVNVSRILFSNAREELGEKLQLSSTDSNGVSTRANETNGGWDVLIFLNVNLDRHREYRRH